MHPFLSRLPAAATAGAAAGTGLGAVAGRHYVAAGFPLLAVDSIRRGVHWAVAGVVVFLLVYELLRRAITGWLPKGFVVPVAAGLAAAPFAALLGLEMNRRWGIRPAEILTSYALARNLGLLAFCGALYVLVCLVLRRWHPAPGRRAWLGLAALAAAVGLLNAGVAGAFGRSVEAKARRPDVVVLLIDALRADRLSSDGYRRQTTPAIDGLARDGVLFRQAVAQSTFTKSSVATLFTGRYPYQHGVYWGSLRLSSGQVISDLLREEETTLAEELRKRGYLTAAWVQNSHLRRVMGFAQGFVSYRDSQGSIERIHRAFRPWLRGPGRRYPYFAYLHYIDLHDPYRPEPPYDTLFLPEGERLGDGGDVYAGIDLDEWGAYLAAVREGRRQPSAAEVEGFEALYDGQLRYIDDQIGELLQELRDLGLYDRSLIVVTSDHGDGFMEHGFISHSTTPYEELVRVPLVVKFPDGRFAGRVVERQVRLVDVMPTVLEAAGARRWPEIAGCSLLPLVEEGEWSRARPSADPGADCDVAVIEIAEEGAYPVVAVRREGWKYIHHEKRPDELYDLERDPGERVNRLAEGGEVASELERIALEVVARRPDPADRVELDEQAVRELKALGYLE